ncbi:MarR family transcriptional regulator [Lactobacillus gigeriorum]|uniref:L-fucose operon regulator n=1 Tax=Lactobacillus gigeriorum DSM 23908 = CRBIP 24.85 TaxID=1423751 RepID=I7LGN1_9LACO|nr:MarR family transcriptional regulator [Lactobacillus gigeriorum]KRN14590.1 L-fucose operon regulator [Lactobacillus gigeriorum DSM 23908 = CRBIP 24.85]CCI87813.1 L-fucose operon regulator [Lactobacillus gigeriorum DSM 23908 = CRBIP 24.85]
MDVLSFNTIADYIKREINHKCGLNLSQTRILLFFYTHNNEILTMGNLAAGLNISLSTLSRQLQQAKTQELITIRRSDSDSSKNVCLNDAGMEKATELAKTLELIKRGLLNQINSDVSSIFLKELLKLSEFTETSDQL